MQQLLEHIKKDSFLKNFSFLTIGQVLSRVINMFSCALLARWLAPEGYGQYSLIITYITLFGVIASLGMEYIINRSVAREQSQSRKYFLICLILRTVGLIISISALFTYNALQAKSFSCAILLSIIAGIFLNSLWAGMQSVSFGMERMKWNSILEVLTSIVTFVVYLIVYFTGAEALTVISVLIIYLSILLFKDIAYYIEIERDGILTGNFKIKQLSLSDIRQTFWQSLPFYLLAIIGLATNQLPILFLDNNSTIEEVAFFNSANKLLLPITILLSTALTALFPIQSKMYINEQDKFWSKTTTVLNFLVVVGSLISCCITLFRGELVYIIFGKQYAHTGDVMAYQCWYLVLFSAFSLNGNILGASDRQKLLSFESLLYAIVTTPIIYHMSFYGAEGLAKGYFVSSLINFVIIYGILIKVSDKKIRIRNIIRSLIIFFIFFVVSATIPESTQWWLKFLILIMCLGAVILIERRWIFLLWKK